jgi:hypothetical protein
MEYTIVEGRLVASTDGTITNVKMHNRRSYYDYVDYALLIKEGGTLHYNDKHYEVPEYSLVLMPYTSWYGKEQVLEPVILTSEALKEMIVKVDELREKKNAELKEKKLAEDDDCETGSDCIR